MTNITYLAIFVVLQNAAPALSRRGLWSSSLLCCARRQHRLRCRPWRTIRSSKMLTQVCEQDRFVSVLVAIFQRSDRCHAHGIGRNLHNKFRDLRKSLKCIRVAPKPNYERDYPFLLGILRYAPPVDRPPLQ
ncbi:hypothetical protein PF005_g18231 [Phytophthora fragariae]|uniref:RxLR effector protein n=1 Tax=Phytophthora fragariae TaxID=53985 RepID=A0A6A3SK15_9STRA|nr:hypothetical protein PF003_g3146 [Phytophthora fragariae]KAE8946219.1 hypothetical protein PF009_g4142 [Phytophthora fragariae]KAE9013411.1 hypothetical protein PF011_g8498 [Phytophthora fragariae]KAE9115110.1 hypothetical protein PF007_g10140 [Phytophthora fragariae]KAE9124248.1 hypothetical protein PF006_g17246 [Phytophthora fragariae]